jgi:hypothetical protein
MPLNLIEFYFIEWKSIPFHKMKLNFIKLKYIQLD